jgi:hexosaminidase
VTVIPTTPTPKTPPPSMGNVIPKPVSVTETGGTFLLSADAQIAIQPASDEVRAIGQYLADHLNPATGYDLRVAAATGTPTSGIFLALNSSPDAGLGDEGYELDITQELVTIKANQPAGLFYGVQTLRQLLPAAIESSTVQPGPWETGTGILRDYPRFAWRGTMLDVSRHFFSVRDVTRYIDLMAYYKINRLHLHLSDDQGWRIEIKTWPNLAAYGGSMEVGGTPGGYYSQSDYAYIVNYASSRYITVVPEIDMPGHINAALASYPELDCSGTTPELYIGIEGVSDSLCVGNDSVNTFVEDVVRELAALTPGPYIHVGGDETMVTDTAQYIQFVGQVQAIVAAQGKQMVGWEEIAQAKLRPDSIAQHWNVDDGFARQAVQQGMKIIMSPADKAYMDMKYTPSTTLGLDWAGDINVQAAYEWDPATVVADGVTEKDILGVEAPLWSETLLTLQDIEYMAFPRLIGYAEIGWTPQSARSWDDYKLRLAAQGPRLQAWGVNYYKSPEVSWP